MNEQFYQGDVLLVRKSSRPRKKVAGFSALESVGGRHVLARGEKTGHDHTIDAMTTQLFAKVGRPGVRELAVYAPTPLVHQEHPPAPLLTGQYDVILQKQCIPEEEPVLSARWE